MRANLEKYTDCFRNFMAAAVICSFFGGMIYIQVKKKAARAAFRKAAQEERATNMTIRSHIIVPSRLGRGDLEVIEGISHTDTNHLMTIVRTAEGISVIKVPYTNSAPLIQPPKAPAP